MPKFLFGLEHALIGAIMGALVALAVKPFKTRTEAFRRFFSSCVFGAMSEPPIRLWLRAENTVEMRVAVGFMVALLAWWLLGIAINTLDRRRNQDAIEIFREIKSGKQEE